MAALFGVSKLQNDKQRSYGLSFLWILFMISLYSDTHKVSSIEFSISVWGFELSVAFTHWDRKDH